MKFFNVITKIFTTPIFTKELTEYKLIISIIIIFLLFFTAKSAGFIFNKFENGNGNGNGFVFIIYILGSWPVYFWYINAYFRNKREEVRSISDKIFLCLSLLLLLPTLLFVFSLFT